MYSFLDSRRAFRARTLTFSATSSPGNMYIPHDPNPSARPGRFALTDADLTWVLKQTITTENVFDVCDGIELYKDKRPRLTVSTLWGKYHESIMVACVFGIIIAALIIMLVFFKPEASNFLSLLFTASVSAAIGYVLVRLTVLKKLEISRTEQDLLKKWEFDERNPRPDSPQEAIRDLAHAIHDRRRLMESELSRWTSESYVRHFRDRTESTGALADRLFQMVRQ